MKSDTVLFQSDKFSFKLNHLVIIGVLILAFSMSFLIRSQSIEYGFELNEFDPFFNFRATEYLLENELSEYFEWHDDKSWYPTGRDISKSSQVMLHITAAYSYQVFGGNLSLYDYTILFPAVIGSLTVIVIFGLVRLFGGTIAGLIASLLFAVSLPILLRGSIGWFKSEPLGIFYGLLGLYFFLSAIQSKNKKIAFLKIISGGVIMAFAMASWGGSQFFVIPIGIFILVLPFVKKNNSILLWTIPVFTTIFLLISGSFERPGPNFVFGIGGMSLIIPTIFLITTILVQKMSKDNNKIKNSLFFLISVIVIGSFSAFVVDAIDKEALPSFRYLNAVNPFLSSNDSLVASVAEHASVSTNISFLLHSVWMIFAGLGVWLILSRKISQNFVKNDMTAFLLIFSITGVYLSSTFVRLELFASISLIMLSSVGLSILTKKIFSVNFSGKRKYLIKISYVVLIIFLFSLPLVIPTNYNWISASDTPPVIFNGATSNPPSNDWIKTLEWIKLNTPENAVIASWWDYGYWITTMSDRTTIVDNATLSTKQIERMAQMLMSTPENSWNMLKEMNADYVVIFLSAQKINDNLDDKLYVLGTGGDESKAPWFAKISEFPAERFYESDLATSNNYFDEQTMLGQMIPFTTAVYYQPQTQENSLSYKPAFVKIVSKDIKYNSEDDPLKLVYASPSFMNEKGGPMNIVLVYQVNKNFLS